MIETEFPKLWIARAKTIAQAVLDKNKQTVNDERARYSMDVAMQRGSAAAEIGKLQAADTQLKMYYDAVKNKKMHVEQAEQQVEEAMAPGVGKTQLSPAQYAERQRAIDFLKKDLKTRNDELRAEIARWGGNFPVLISPGYVPGGYASLSYEQASQQTGLHLQEVLDNIEETKGNISDNSIKVWDLNHVPEMTFQDLNIQPNSPLGKAVMNYIKGEKSAADALKKAWTVFQFSIVAGAIVATAGGAAALAGALLLVEGGLGVIDLVLDVQTYLQESAAENAGLHPDFQDLSKLEPELLPIALDLISLGMSIGEVVHVAKNIKGALNQLRAGSMTLDEFVLEGMRLGMPEAAAKQFGKQAAAMAFNPDTIKRVAGALGDQARGAYSLAQAVEGLKKYVTPKLGSFIDSLMAKGKIRLFPTDPDAAADVLIRAVGQTRANELIHAGYMKAGGFFDPQTGLIFVKRGSFSFTQSTLVHEAVHALQKQYGRSFSGFGAEIEAFLAQRQYLRNVAMDFPAARNIPDVGWLVDSSVDDIIKYIEEQPLYLLAKPGDFDIQETILDLLNDIDKLAKAGIIAAS